MSAKPVEETPVFEEKLELVLPGADHMVQRSGIKASQILRRMPRLIRRAMMMAWEVDRRSVVALVGCQVVLALMEAFGLAATAKMLTSIIGAGDIKVRLWSAAPGLVWLGVALGAAALLRTAINGISIHLAPKLGRGAEFLLLDAATNAEVEAYDNPGYNDRFDAADRGVDIARDIMGDVQHVISAFASLLAAAGVLTVLHPLLLPMLIIAALPQGMATIFVAKTNYESALRSRSDRRLLSMTRWFLADKSLADQVRTDGMAKVLLGKYREVGDRLTEEQTRAAWRSSWIQVGGAAAGGLATVMVWSVLVFLLASGRMSVASAGTAVFALRTASAGVAGMVGYGAQLYRASLYLDDLWNFVDEAGGYRMNRGQFQPAAPLLVSAKDITYRYTGSEKEAVRGLNFEVRSGEIVAVVGENGSGKSTLMRMLSGLVLPKSGEVSWDGVSTREMDHHAMWEHVAAIPQQFARWPLTARENIQLGTDISDTQLRKAMWASGADSVVDGLRSGLGTLLAREFWGGIDLSGGQWQRIAVARGFRHTSGLLILDEPTSALDPRAEHRIFKNLRQNAAGRPVVLVTHNMANCAVADRIVVMDSGVIAQEGTFAQLSSREGLFKELLELQQDRSPIPGQRSDNGISDT